MLQFSFVDYGVMLEINDLQYLPDGRSFLDCVGGRRFKVLDYYEKLVDLSLTEMEKSGNSLLQSKQVKHTPPPPPPDSINELIIWKS